MGANAPAVARAVALAVPDAQEALAARVATADPAARAVVTRDAAVPAAGRVARLVAEAATEPGALTHEAATRARAAPPAAATAAGRRVGGAAATGGPAGAAAPAGGND